MATLKFLQTGDWHIGQPYRNLDDDLARDLRRARLEAVSRALDEARRRSVAFVLACGDQFDGPWPDTNLVRDLLDRIAAYPQLPIYMIPGNHDPATASSVYDRRDFKQPPPNLTLIDRPRDLRLHDHGATLFACPCTARFGPNPMDWIPARSGDDGWRIGLAHGSLPACATADDQNYPIPADAPARYDLDYVALGDWHTPTPDPLRTPGARMFYAGAPEVGGWDETGAGFALEVALVEQSPPVVQAVRTGRYRWEEIRPELHGEEDLARLDRTLDDLAAADRIVRVRPHGALGVADRKALEARIEPASSRFAGLLLDLRDLRLQVDRDGEPPPDPILREVHRRLLRLLADPADAVPSGLPADLPTADAEVVQRAFARFQGLLP